MSWIIEFRKLILCKIAEIWPFSEASSAKKYKLSNLAPTLFLNTTFSDIWRLCRRPCTNPRQQYYTRYQIHTFSCAKLCCYEQSTATSYLRWCGRAIWVDRGKQICEREFFHRQIGTKAEGKSRTCIKVYCWGRPSSCPGDCCCKSAHSMTWHTSPENCRQFWSMFSKDLISVTPKALRSKTSK